MPPLVISSPPASTLGYYVQSPSSAPVLPPRVKPVDDKQTGSDSVTTSNKKPTTAQIARNQHGVQYKIGQLERQPDTVFQAEPVKTQRFDDADAYAVRPRSHLPNKVELVTPESLIPGLSLFLWIGMSPGSAKEHAFERDIRTDRSVIDTDERALRIVIKLDSKSDIPRLYALMGDQDVKIPYNIDRGLVFYFPEYTAATAWSSSSAKTRTKQWHAFILSQRKPILDRWIGQESFLTDQDSDEVVGRTMPQSPQAGSAHVSVVIPQTTSSGQNRENLGTTPRSGNSFALKDAHSWIDFWDNTDIPLDEKQAVMVWRSLRLIRGKERVPNREIIEAVVYERLQFPSIKNYSQTNVWLEWLHTHAMWDDSTCAAPYPLPHEQDAGNPADEELSQGFRGPQKMNTHQSPFNKPQQNVTKPHGGKRDGRHERREANELDTYIDELA